MRRKKQKKEPQRRCSSFIYGFYQLVLEEIFHVLIGNHLLIEDVSTSLGALHHLDNPFEPSWRVATVFFAIVYLII